MPGANARRLWGDMEVQRQLPFIFRGPAVNKYDRAYLSWPSSEKKAVWLSLHWLWDIWLIQIRKGAGIKTATKKGEKYIREEEREGSHVEDTSFNVTFIILQQPLEKRQPWGSVEHTALMTTTGETQWTLESGHHRRN